MISNIDISKFYKELYKRTVNRCYLNKQKSFPLGLLKNKNVAVYYFKNPSYLKMEYRQINNVLIVSIIIERNCINQYPIILRFSEEELQDKLTIDLLESIILLINECKYPNKYTFESDYLTSIIINNEEQEVEFPLTINDYKNTLYCNSDYQILLFNIEHCKDNPKVWIEFAHSKYFNILKEFIGKSYIGICKTILKCELPLYQKIKLIPVLNNYKLGRFFSWYLERKIG